MARECNSQFGQSHMWKYAELISNVRDDWNTEADEAHLMHKSKLGNILNLEQIWENWEQIWLNWEQIKNLEQNLSEFKANSRELRPN